MTYLLLLLGFVFLIKGADLLVDGASSVAKRFSVSNLVIGLTIVAFGTSAPELFVNLFASFNGTADIAIGNIVGSNIANTFLILGIAALIYPIAVSKGTAWKEIPLSLLAMLLLIVMANDFFIDGIYPNIISRSEGFVLISFFIVFLYYTFGIANNSTDEADEGNVTVHPLWKSVGYILLGGAGLVFGGNWIVSGATHIASIFGLSDALIGLTVVAVGTSLPELATSAVAAYKKNSDIAIGNVVGSNIFNIFWILGLSSLIKPLPFSEALNFDLAVALGASVLLFVWVFVGRKYKLQRWQGAFFVLIYVVYITAIVLRG